MHPAERLRLAAGKGQFAGKHLLLCVTGSIAAVEDVRLVREFLRRGGQVTVAMTESATRIIHPEALWFSSGKKVVTALDGDVQHVTLCTQGPGSVDAVLVAPCTANAISKLATGICDDAVSTMLVTALGSGKPIMLAPSMHGSMWANAIIQENIEKLVSLGVTLIQPNLEEGKAKMADIETIVLTAGRIMLGSPLKGKKITVIGGSTDEPIDSVRSITNGSTGGTAMSLVKEAYLQGADVELILGRCKAIPPSFVNVKRFKTVADLKRLTSGKRYGIVLVPAAISDFTVEKPVKGKIASEKDKLAIVLKRTPKIVDSINAKSIIGFKLEAGVTVEELKERAIARMKAGKMSAIVANRAEDITDETSTAYFIDRSGRSVELKGIREEIARGIIANLSKVIK
jgi:phosphopantothenoylcysteine decarboxylase / phosphopantothenate---cysteine ligase